jgi:L-ascorbate oxidase
MRAKSPHRYQSCANVCQHWHGLSQRVAPFSDGTPTASQWPIAPHQYFDYEVHPEAGDAGTYFYHSHVGFQAVSAHGALTVVDAEPSPYQYDEERVMLLTDYFNKTDEEIESGLVSQPFVWSGEPNAVLLNGIGVSDGEEAGTDACQLPVVSVEPDKRYRLRFIGGTALSMVQIAFEGHDTLEIIAADGQYTKPYRTAYVQVSPGQRFDAILQTKSAAELTNQTDFVIQYESRARPSVLRSYGILRYLNTPSRVTGLITKGPQKPTLELPENAYDFLEYALEPLVPNGFPTAEEVTRRITITARQLTAGSTIWQLNGLQWNETTPTAISSDDRPYLVALYEDGPAAMPNYTAAMENSGWDPETFAFPAKLGEVLEIVWENTGSLVSPGGGIDYHPFHAHGKHYYDCGSGNGTYDPVANEAKLKDYNPVLRDTTNLYRYETKTTTGADAGWRAWRLRVEDAGVWMVHCHILQHSE